MTIIRGYQARERRRGSSSGYSPMPETETSSYREPAMDQLRMMTEEEAEQIKHSAQDQSQGIIAQARQEAQRIKTQAQQEGLEQGKQQGYQTVAQTVTAAQQLIKQAELERNRIVDSAKKEVLALSTQIAQRILHQELTSNTEHLMQIIADAISKISDRDQIIIRVSKDDLEFFKSHRDKIEDLLDGVKNLTIQSDKHVGVGGLIIETKLGVVDARLETKMEVLQKAMFAVYDQDAKTIGQAVSEDEPVVEGSALVEGAMPQAPEAPAATTQEDNFDFNVDDLNLDDLDLDLEEK